MKEKESDILMDAKGLKKSFGDHHVLKNVDLSLKKGENLVVLGRSGTGKSVLIKCLTRLINVDAGKIWALGEDIMSLEGEKMNKLRQRMGFLFQGGALYDSMSVRENLEFPVRRVLKKNDEKELDQMVREALENVGLEESIDKMPSELSGGMRKRIALARTLMLDPEIIFYDEPTTGLDPITSREISELIQKVRKQNNNSSIIITHDLACASITADRILILNEGEFIAEGSYQELSKSKDETVKKFFE